MVVLILIFAFPTSAQEPTPEPEQTSEPLDQEEIIALATQVAETIEQVREIEGRSAEAMRRAEELLEQSHFSIDLIFNMLNSLQIVAIVVGAFGALIGFGRYRQFIRDTVIQSRAHVVAEAKNTIQLEMNKAETNIVQRVGEEQRKMSEKAIKALSLLPLGQQQYLVQDYNGAMDTYERALKLDENNAVINYRLGYVNILMDELEQAEDYLNVATKIDPEFQAAQAALGYVYRRRAELLSDSSEKTQLINDAENMLLEALTKSPKLVDADGESWWGALGSLRRRFRDNEAAIDAYERAAEVTPHSSYPLGNLALLYGETGGKVNLDKMLEIYKKVETLSRSKTLVEPYNYWLYTDLLAAELVLGKFDAAEETLKNVIDNMTDAKSPLESLLRALERLEKMVTEEDKKSRIQDAVKRLQERIEEMDAS